MSAECQTGIFTTVYFISAGYDESFRSLDHTGQTDKKSIKKRAVTMIRRGIM